MTFDGPSTGLTPQEGVLIVDPASQTIRMGDGSTQGGVAIAGGGGGGGSTAWADITGKPTTISGFGITDALTTTLTSDAVIGNNKLKYTASGDGGSQLVLAKTMYSVPNTTVFSSVGSIDLYIDSLSADTAQTAFRIFNNTDPDGTVTETSNIFKVDGNTGDVSVTGKVLLPDGSTNANYAGFGANDDLKIFHNGNHSIVRETGTGSLYLQSDDNVILSKDSDTEIMVKGIADGAVELYHDNVKKFETSANGVSIVDDAHVEGATPYVTIKRTDNANIPLIRFQGSNGFNGATIGMDGTGGTVNDLIISAYGGVERIRTGTTGTQITGSFALGTSGTEPTSSGDAGEVGEVRYTDNYIYIKTSAGWKRANLSAIV